ncbi:MAG: SDR family oxidoreductase [Lentisphaeria bacterium]|nr:SDR family oxidoreductase [Lentisphaeria bacterium]NQZ68801.1 SDR family oxidoreductase [Lentisphaeria bacterium]
MLPFKIDLSDKVIAVTGGGGVLCGEMAKALAECGAKVAVLSRKQENADTVADAILASGGQALAVSCNVLELDSITAAYEKISSQLGDCDILINGAGGNSPDGTADLETVDSEDIKSQLDKSFFGLTAEGISFVFDLNFTGTVLTTQVFAKAMSEKGQGSIINISSMAAYHPLTKVMSYSASKAAINNFTEWLAVHLAPTGVRVNAIAPGFFLTKQNEQLLMGDNNTPTERCQKIIDHTPMGRLGKADELIGALLYLASEDASGFVTGTVMAVDGGFNAYSGV